jgi:hypothetical protein
MIVTKIWTTTKRGKWNTFHFEGRFYSTKESHWEGWFLFGVIPLFIRNTKSIYSQ